jgi:hypothetical protein
MRFTVPIISFTVNSMSLKPVGSQWLKQHYNLSHYLLTHSSYIGSNESLELTSKGNVEQIYGPK